MNRSFLRNLLFIVTFSVVSLSSWSNNKESNDVLKSKIDSIIKEVDLVIDTATNYQISIQYLNEAKIIAEKLGDKYYQSVVLNYVGLAEYTSGNYEKAVSNYLEALIFAEESNDSGMISVLDHNLGMIYDELEDYDEAIKWNENALSIAKRRNDTLGMAQSYQNLAIVYQNKQDYEKARNYNQLAYDLAVSNHDTIVMIDVTNNLGTIAYEEEKYDESLNYYTDALKGYIARKDKTGMAMAYNNIGLIHFDKKEYNASLEYFNKALKLAYELDMYDFTGDVYSNLAEYYEELKDFEKAYYYYKKQDEVYDNLVGEKRDKTIRQIQAKYQIGKWEKDLQALEERNIQQRETIDNTKSIQRYTIAVIIFIAILAVILYYFLNKEKKLAKELHVKTEELRKLNASKDRFFSIIAHDLKNPFNALISYTSILKTDYNVFSKEELEQIFNDLNNASEQGFNLLQNLLVWTRSQTNRIHVFKTNFRITDVIEDVVKIASVSLSKKEQKLNSSIGGDIMVHADKEMIATVLRNLVFNAIKFSKKGSEIVLSSEMVNGNVVISVKDFGIGIDEVHQEKLFNIDESITKSGTDGESGTGLGLIICSEFVEKNDGTIWVESKPGRGSVFSFTLPCA